MANAAVGDPVCISGGDCYSTIQSAINAASSGAIITVASGTYNESVIINKSITLRGAQAGVDARPSAGSMRDVNGSSETVVSALKNQKVFTIAADGVTIDGLFVRQTSGSGESDAIKASNSQSNITIVNTIVVDATDEAIQLEAGVNYNVSQNYILNPVGDGITFSTYSPFKGTNLAITNNEITGSTSAYGSIYLYGAQNVELSGNLINTRSTGVALGTITEPVSNIVVRNNTVNTELYTAYSSLATAIGLDGNSSNVTIERNKLQQVGAVADSREAAYPDRFNLIRVGVAPTANPANVIIKHNDFSRITQQNYLYIGSNVTNTIAASENWWGSQANPASKITNSSATVVSSPWLCGPWGTNPASTTDGSCDSTAPTDVVATSDIDGKFVQNANQDITFSAEDDAGLKRFDVTLWKKNDNRSNASTILGSWGATIAAKEKTDATRTVNIRDNILYSSHKDLPEGEYAIYYTATDQTSKSTNGNVVTFTIDKTRPAAPTNLAVRVTANGAYIPNNGYTNQKNVTASWKNGANEDVTYIYNYWKTEGSRWTESNKWPHPTSQPSYAGSYNQDEGVHKFCVVAVDRAGNRSDCSATYTVTYDITPPTAKVVAPANGSVVRATIDITGKMTDETQAGSHWFEIKGNNYEYTTGAGHDNGTDTWTINWDTATVPDGTYTIRYVAKDKAGNRNDVNGSVVHTVTVDNTAPSININPIATSFNTSRPTIIGTVDTDATLVEVSTDGGATWVAATAHDKTAGIWSYTYTSSLVNKSHHILARATDQYGNRTEGQALATRTFAVLVTVPADDTDEGDEEEVVTNYPSTPTNPTTPVNNNSNLLANFTPAPVVTNPVADTTGETGDVAGAATVNKDSENKG